MIADSLFDCVEEIKGYLSTDLGRAANAQYMPEIQELLEKMHALRLKLDHPREAT